MRITSSTNLSQVLGDLDRTAERIVAVAVPRALNEIRDQALTAAARSIAAEYRIGVREVTGSRYLRISAASAAKPEARIALGGPGFALSRFNPRKAPGGIAVTVKGRTFVIPGAFLARMPLGHIIVGARGAYGGKSGRPLRPTGRFGRFIFGRGEREKRPNKWGSTELPINEFLTFSLGDALANPTVTEAALDRAQEQIAKVMQREIAAALRLG